MITAAPDPRQPAARPALRWQQAWRDAVRDPLELLALLGLESLADRVSDQAASQFALRVPRGFVARMRAGDPHDPLLRQVLPLDDEMRPASGYGLDAVGDGAARTGNGVIQKYRGRALLVATGSCAINCRYCFRRHFPYAEETAARDGWREAVDVIRRDDSIEEVLLSGGDPLSLSDAKLAELTDALAGIPHLRRLRLHSRLPVVLPERIDEGLLAWLGRLPWPVTLVIHANHANEFDGAVDAALRRLRDAGVHLLNQAVLLRGVNDDVDALAALSERGFAAGVLPYYLHQLDPAPGTARFRVPEAEGLALVAGLRGRVSGLGQPTYVKETPGGGGKVPVR